MLSDLKYSNDILNNHINSVNVPAKRNKRNEKDIMENANESFYRCESKEAEHFSRVNPSCHIESGFQTDISHNVPFVECARPPVYSLNNNALSFASVGDYSAYIDIRDKRSGESKTEGDCRDELSTPVTITPLEMSVIANGSNHIYGSVNETSSTWSSIGCIFDQRGSDNNFLSNDIEDSLDAMTNSDFDRPAYVFSSNPPCEENIEREKNIVSLASPPVYSSLFWIEDSGENPTEVGFSDSKVSNTAPHLIHSETSISDKRLTPTDSIILGTFEEAHLMSEPQPKSVKLDCTASYIQNENVELSSKITNEVANMKRDKLTGKFKQQVAEHSNTMEKLCKVCNDRAVNHNFGQLTCESCKAFFRRNAHKELTCTLKSGEHEITPTTRRECPACRLKKCFLVGMRPDLIQVRKKDGSKPRWLEKVPNAAMVHEKHLHSADTNRWTLEAIKGRSESDAEAIMKHQPTSKESREDVCSTDSGSCFSLETASAPLDICVSKFGERQKNSKLDENINMMEASPTNELLVTEAAAVSRNGAYPCGSTSTVVNHKDLTIGYYPMFDGILSPGQLLTVAADNTLSDQRAFLQQGLPTNIGGLRNPQISTNGILQSANMLNSGHLNTKLLPSANKSEQWKGIEDVILLTNGHHLIVPTNVVTIGTATPVCQSAFSSNGVHSANQTFGINVPTVGLNSAQLAAPQLQCKEYTNHFSNKLTSQNAPDGTIVMSGTHPGVAQTCFPSTWNPSDSSSFHELIQDSSRKEPVAQGFITSAPNCILTTPIQSTGQIETNNVVDASEFAHPLCKPATVTTATSFCISVKGITAPVSAVTLTAVLPSVSSVPTSICSHNTSEAVDNLAAKNSEPTELLYNVNSCSVSELLASANPIQLDDSQCEQESYVGVVTNPLSWGPEQVPNFTVSQPPCSQFLLSGINHTVGQQTLITAVSGLSNTRLVAETNMAENAAREEVTIATNNVCPSISPHLIDTINNPSDMLAVRCSLQDVVKAWTAMWKNGEFPNPEKINLQIDITERSSLSWRLTLANIWDDIFLRRISVFAVALFGPLCCLDEQTAALLRNETNNATSIRNQKQENLAETLFSGHVHNADGKQPSKNLLTWHDLLWIAKHRFSDCVPILLIGCLTATEIGSNWMQFSNDPTATQLVEQQSMNWTRDKIRGVTDNGIQYRTAFQTATEETPVTIKFKCNPGGPVSLSLTKLSQSLAQLTVKAVRTKFEDHPEQSAYPIMQYLDAYVSQFGRFLAHQPLLLGAFLALKLTDPQVITDLDCHARSDGLAVHVTGSSDRAARLRKIHEHFIRVFSEAADKVASIASSEIDEKQNMDRPLYQSKLAEISSHEMAAANSRREMLKDFLSWSRRFDAAWHKFESDTWNQAIYENKNATPGAGKFRISQGLNALHGCRRSSDVGEQSLLADSDTNYHGLLQLLLDAKTELRINP